MEESSCKCTYEYAIRQAERACALPSAIFFTKWVSVRNKGVIFDNFASVENK
jgi:hypothetical protein